MFGGIIKKRVKAALNQKINDAEKAYAAQEEVIREQAETKIQEVKVEADIMRKKTQDEIVESIIGK